MAIGAMMKCIVKDCVIIRVIDSELNNCTFLYGTVVDDEQGRFSPEDYVFTSLITGTALNRVDTVNTTYITTGQYQEIPLTLRAATYLKLTGAVASGELFKLSQDGTAVVDISDLPRI